VAESSTDPTTPLMTGWRRLRSIQGAAVAGIVAAVGWVVALGALLDVPGPTSTDAEITAYYAAHAGSARPLVFLQILVIATIGFLWFIGVIRHRLGAAEPKLFGTVFLGGGILLAGLMFVGVAAAATPAILVGETDRLVDPDAVVTMRVFCPDHPGRRCPPDRQPLRLLDVDLGLAYRCHVTLDGGGQLPHRNCDVSERHHCGTERLHLSGLDGGGERLPVVPR